MSYSIGIGKTDMSNSIGIGTSKNRKMPQKSNFYDLQKLYLKYLPILDTKGTKKVLAHT